MSVRVSSGWCGELWRVDAAQALVIVSEGAGALTATARCQRLCRVLHGYALSTLCIALTAPPGRRPRDDEGDWREGFEGALGWLDAQSAAHRGPVGLFGEDTAATAALRAVAAQNGRVAALVCCGGHIEQAGAMLDRVRAATLLLVGALDAGLLAGHREALLRLRGPARLEAIPAATRRFSEPGAFDTVAHLAGSWLHDHLGTSRR